MPSFKDLMNKTKDEVFKWIKDDEKLSEAERKQVLKEFRKHYAQQLEIEDEVQRQFFKDKHGGTIVLFEMPKTIIENGKIKNLPKRNRATKEDPNPTVGSLKDVLIPMKGTHFGKCQFFAQESTFANDLKYEMSFIGRGNISYKYNAVDTAKRTQYGQKYKDFLEHMGVNSLSEVGKERSDYYKNFTFNLVEILLKETDPEWDADDNE